MGTNSGLTDSLRRDDMAPKHHKDLKVKPRMMWAVMLGNGSRPRCILPYRRVKRALRLIKHVGYHDAYITRFGLLVG